MTLRSLLFALCLSLPFSAFSTEQGHDGHNKDQAQPVHDMENMHDGHDMKEMHKESGNGTRMKMGRPGDAHEVSRTVTITMDDSLRFSPDNISVKTGETVRFFLKNSGGMMHEMVLGSREDLHAHAEMMRSMPDMKHADPDMARVNPGKRSAIIWHFDKPGTLHFGCLVPGHLEGGMAGTITVQ